MASDDHPALAPSGGFTVPVDNVHPLGNHEHITPGEQVQQAPAAPRRQILLAIDPRLTASVLLVVVGAALGGWAAFRVSFTLFLAVAAVLCLGIGLALGYESDGRGNAEEG